MSLSPTPTPPLLRQGPAPTRVRAAWIVALLVDFVQIVAMPVFAGGVMSPATDVLDVVTGILMVRLLGWHWAFLPSFIAELVPGVGLIPTWTLAVWVVTRRRDAR